jgi:hypothetical protein
METLIVRLFHNWQRKCVALLTAIIVWIFVSHSINEVKTISNVPIRIVNLPADTTIPGLLPNGILSKRITLTLTGTKDIIDELEPGDLEVLLDASTADQEEWIVQISKKNLVSLNPSIDLAHHISQVSHSNFVIKLTKLVTAKIPVTIEPPTGNPPPGYEYLDIWPQQLTQTLSGPEEEVQRLKEKGLRLVFDLGDITKQELDAIKTAGQNQHNDEISFLVPRKWKQVAIPFRNNVMEELNDPEAQNLRIDFLRKDFLPLEKKIPIRVFYPLDNSDTINPEIFKLAIENHIQEKNGIPYLAVPLYVRDVSRLFIDVVQNYMEIVIVASPKNEREILGWSVQFVDPHELEDTYVAFSLANFILTKNSQNDILKKREDILRKRFRDYMQRLSLYVSDEQKLHIKSYLEGNFIKVSTN